MIFAVHGSANCEGKSLVQPGLRMASFLGSLGREDCPYNCKSRLPAPKETAPPKAAGQEARESRGRRKRKPRRLQDPVCSLLFH